MLMHKSSLLLVLPLLFTLPTGMVKANDLDIQTGTVRVTIDHNNGIRIESANSGTIFVPSHSPMSNAAWSRYPSRQPMPTLSTQSAASPVRPQTLAPSRCTGQTEQSNQSSHSNGGISQTYSSMSTSVCH
jgi:hypothetical protein